MTTLQETNKVLRRIGKLNKRAGELTHTLPTSKAKDVVKALNDKGYATTAKGLWWNRLVNNPFTTIKVGL